MTHDVAVLIGRFQPFHLGHLSLVEAALAKARRLLPLLGSHQCSPDSRNPWSSVERQERITTANLRRLLEVILAAGCSLENVASGIGGGLLQPRHRDSRLDRIHRIHTSGSDPTVVRPHPGRWPAWLQSLGDNGRPLHRQSLEQIRARELLG